MVQYDNTITSSPRRMLSITFIDVDFKVIDPLQDDPVVITVKVEQFVIMKTLVDKESFVDILYWKTFKNLWISKDNIQPYDDQIVGFSGKMVDTMGYIDLYTKFGKKSLNSRIIKVWYLIVDANTLYNMRLGRHSLNKLGAIMCTPHLAVKFPSTSGDIITIHIDLRAARECYATSLQVKCLMPNIKTQRPSTITIALVDLNLRVNYEIWVHLGEKTTILKLGGEECCMCVANLLSPVEVKIISQTLIKNVDLFALTVVDMSGVDPNLISHKLSNYWEARLVSQKERKLRDEKR